MSFVLNLVEWYITCAIRLFWEKHVLDRFLYSMNSTNALNMTKNLTKPLYQDDSAFGRTFGFLIRSVWVSIGTLYSLLAVFPFVVAAFFVTLAPILPLVSIVHFIL